MSRLIDADELKRELKWLEVDAPVYHDVMSTIDEIATVDAVEVVRCKDCQHFKKTFGWNTLEYTECDHFDCDVSEDGFCAWGERKDEVEEDG